MCFKNFAFTFNHFGATAKKRRKFESLTFEVDGEKARQREMEYEAKLKVQDTKQKQIEHEKNGMEIQKKDETRS